MGHGASVFTGQINKENWGDKTVDPNAAPTPISTIRVVLPFHLRTLARVEGDVELAVQNPVTVRQVLDALESSYPMLRGTIREYETGARRAFLRFFACEQDWSNEPQDKILPEAVQSGREPLIILGAIAGG